MKTILSLSLVGMLAVMLTACDGGSGVDDSQVKPPPATPIKSPSTERTMGQSDQGAGAQQPPPKEEE